MLENTKQELLEPKVIEYDSTDDDYIEYDEDDKEKSKDKNKDDLVL